MNPYVADLDWGWWIVCYFFLGGLAAGLYFLASLIEVVGREEDRVLARLGYRLALPLICVCGALLTIDLERPERFWHMLLQSEVVHAALDAGWPLGGWGTMLQAPLLKWWSPMSIGAWALSWFGLWSLLSFIGTFRAARPLGTAGIIFRLIGSTLGFFIASYTGVLLSATNQPWSVSEWIGPLFLSSAASTSLAVLLLFGRSASPETRRRLEHADLCAVALETMIFFIFLASLRGLLLATMTKWLGWLVYFTLLTAMLLPFLLHLVHYRRRWRYCVPLAALLALGGGFLLRYTVVAIGPSLLTPLAAHVTPAEISAPLSTSAAGRSLLFVTFSTAVVLLLGLSQTFRLDWRRGAVPGVLCIAAVLTVVYYTLQPIPASSAFLGDVGISPEDGRPYGDVGASALNRANPPHLRSKIAKDAAHE